MSNKVSQAHALIARGDVRGAARILEQAEQTGDALGARELALWYLEGRLLRRDLATSRALFERAAALGDATSATVVRAFVAGGVGGPADWPRAIDMLRQAAPGDPQAAAQLQLIEAMTLGPDGEPAGTFAAEKLCDGPEVQAFLALFSPAECDYLIRTAGPMLQPSIVIDPHTGRHIPNPVRTSSGAVFPFVDENPAIHALNRRLAAASGSDVRAGEPMWVLHYAPGEQYHEHSDVLPGIAPSQQRVMTFLVYLNEDYEGGETVFPAGGVKFRGRAGDGLLFRNAAPDGTPDPRSVHAGLPVTRGIKHLASRWIRAAPLVLE
ncbi:2OG-Fe(II) oxygenase [Sphingomonas sp.]|uniref:2OG-Fe(II) oxygenase n=1 Tax=Sphingomonas sp. TaxID=28214 RepID=UPI0038A1D024